MREVKHILFPVDLSRACSQFAPIVRSIACRTGAHLTLLHTLELPRSYESNPVAFRALVDVRAALRTRRSEFNEYLKAEFADLPSVSRVFRRGDPAQRILAFAKTRHVDLIMLPTQGLGPLRRLLIGSVAAKVLHDAECPVWTSAHAPETPQTERLSKILCAIDLTERNTGIMQYAQGLARTFGAQLRFLNVVAVGESWPVRQFEADFVARLVDTARQELRTLQAEAGTTGETEVRSGEIARSVRREALEWKADAIVIGRGVLAETFGRLRSETYKIIRESPCQVISVVG